ncbi:hypothetical protein MTO96_049619 [Rhipicephalus appendiculatus]
MFGFYAVQCVVSPVQKYRGLARPTRSVYWFKLDRRSELDSAASHYRVIECRIGTGKRVRLCARMDVYRVVYAPEYATRIVGRVELDILKISSYSSDAGKF